jgi:hypothetical protein
MIQKRAAKNKIYIVSNNIHWDSERVHGTLQHQQHGIQRETHVHHP